MLHQQEAEGPLADRFFTHHLQVGQVHFDLHAQAQGRDIQDRVTVLYICDFPFKAHEGTAVDPGNIFQLNIRLYYRMLFEPLKKPAHFIYFALWNSGWLSVVA